MQQKNKAFFRLNCEQKFIIQDCFQSFSEETLIFDKICEKPVNYFPPHLTIHQYTMLPMPMSPAKL